MDMAQGPGTIAVMADTAVIAVMTAGAQEHICGGAIAIMPAVPRAVMIMTIRDMTIPDMTIRDITPRDPTGHAMAIAAMAI